jgi:tetratricopeptide (TPR) repeat protein
MKFSMAVILWLGLRYAAMHAPRQRMFIAAKALMRLLAHKSRGPQNTPWKLTRSGRAAIDQTRRDNTAGYGKMRGNANEMTRTKTPLRRRTKYALAALLLAAGLASARPQQPPPERRPAAPAARKPGLATAKPGPGKAAPPDASLVEAVRENTVGMALMDRRDYANALGRFQTACVMNSASDIGCLNMGIALLNMRRYDEARQILEKSVERDPQNARAWYNLALLARATGDSAAARDDLQNVAAVDPNDPGTQYFLGYLSAQDQKYEQAVAAFQRAIELDPLHISAEFGLSQAEQDLGHVDAAKADLARFHRLSAEKLGKPVRFLYGEQGPYSLAQEMTVRPGPPPPPTLVHFLDVTAASGLPGFRSAAAAPVRPLPAVRRPTAARTVTDPPPSPSLAGFLGSGACVFDFDGDGRPDIFLVDADGEGNAALYRNTGKGTFVNVSAAAKLAFHGQGMSCAVGDYDNDGHPDLAIASGDGITLFHNEGNGTFKDVTESAGLRPATPAAPDSASQPAQADDRAPATPAPSAPATLAMGVTFIDYDQDGDLDIYVTRFTDFAVQATSQPFTFPEGAPAPGNILWRNNGDGTFVDKTSDLALAGAAPSVGAIGCDLGNNQAIDLVVTGWQKYPSVFLNTREGPFLPASPWAISMPGPAAGVVAADFDHDSWMDLAFTHWASPAVTVWRNVQGKSFERVPLVEPGWMRAWGIAAFDYDNDGWVDLVAVGETFSGEGRIELFRNEGPAGFRDVTHETGLDKIALRNPRSVIPFDFDGDGSPGLLITQNNLPPVLLKNVGGNDNTWLKLALSGDPDNKLAIGARLDVFSGAARQAWEVSGASGYLGQGPAEILTGLGSASEADVLRIVWPTGLLQNELHVAGDAPTPVPESEPPEQPKQ